MSILGDLPVAAELGTLSHGMLGWDEPLTETPTVGDTEVWNITNLTEDAHPIHLHLVMFQVLDRRPFDRDHYEDTGEVVFTGPARAAESWEQGWKDTVIAYPGEVTRIIAKFDLPGLYVWHCHILEHEDNEMMRPYRVVLPSVKTPLILNQHAP
jgi:spore coat protein A